MPLIILAWFPILTESDIITPPTISSLALGELVPMPTFCAIPGIAKNKKNEMDDTLCIIDRFLNLQNNILIYLTEILFPLATRVSGYTRSVYL
jgi:hypothetical protein